MGYKLLEVTLISANGLKSVNHFGEMDVYVSVSMSGAKIKTPVHKRGGVSPSWNYTGAFKFDEATALNRNWSVVFKIKHRRTFVWDKLVGEVRVPVKELLVVAGDRAEVKTLTGKSKGELKFSCKLQDTTPPPPPPVYQPMLPPPPLCPYAHKRHSLGVDWLGMFGAGITFDV